MKFSRQFLLSLLIFAGGCEQKDSTEPGAGSPFFPEVRRSQGPRVADKSKTHAEVAIPPKNDGVWRTMLVQLTDRPSDFKTLVEKLFESEPWASDDGEKLIDLVRIIANQKVSVPPEQYVEVVESRLKGSNKGAAYNAIVVGLIGQNDFSSAEAVIEAMPVSAWRSRETERFFASYATDSRRVADSFSKIAEMDVPEDRKRAVSGAGRAAAHALSSGAIPASVLPELIDAALLDEEEKAAFRKQLELFQ